MLRKLYQSFKLAYRICNLCLVAEPSPNTLTDDLAKLVNNDDFSDITFLVEGRKIHAHKAILVVRSDYFNAMFSNGMQESSKVGNS